MHIQYTITMCILTCLLALSPNDVNSSASLRQSDCILGHESSLPAVHGVFNMGSVLMELGRKKREELKVIKEEERGGRGEEEERRVEESGGRGGEEEGERKRESISCESYSSPLWKARISSQNCRERYSILSAILSIEDIILVIHAIWSHTRSYFMRVCSVTRS